MPRMTGLRVTCLVCVLGLITFLVLYHRSGVTGMSTRKSENNQSIFPFEMVDEHRNDGVGGPMWVARFVVPKEHYTRENLDLLFCSYSKRHVDKNERLQVRVYTDPADVPQGGQPTGPDEPDKHKALFYRHGYGAAAGGGRNENYFYCPDPDNPGGMKDVVLRGTWWNSPRTIFRTWRFSNESMRIRVLAYDLKGIDPPGLYYSFQSFDDQWKEWQTVMTLQQGGDLLAPSDNVHFISRNSAYIAIGPLFGVTLDGGKSWSTFDAGRDLESVPCFEQVNIERVSIDQSGAGSLSLRLSSNNSTKELSTGDFGSHWRER